MGVLCVAHCLRLILIDFADIDAAALWPILFHCEAGEATLCQLEFLLLVLEACALEASFHDLCLNLANRHCGAFGHGCAMRD